jgi:hypothetical protein
MSAVVMALGLSLKDQLCFAFFLLSNIIDLCNEVLNFSQKGESLVAAWSKYNQLALSSSELSIPNAMVMQHFVHGLVQNPLNIWI